VLLSRRVVAVIVGCFLMVFGSASHGQSDEQGYQIKPGDVLSISVWGEEQLQGTALVTPDGGFSFPLVGHLNARGRTAEEVQQIVRDRLREYLSDPVVTVSLQEINGNTIYVIGQVNNPGEFVLRRSIDVMQALSMAGGTTTFASLNDILILRRQSDGQVALSFRYSDVIKGRRLEQNIQLQSGDVVVVP
jgi:polysaccharide export outer membrane protein